MEREIVVRGSAEMYVMPDRAVLHVTVDGEGTTSDEAYSAARAVANAVDAVFAAEAPSFERVRTASLVVQPRTGRKQGVPIRTGWTASRTTSADVVSLDRVGDIVAHLAKAGASVRGPAWTLDPHNDAHGLVRREAAADAYRRAEQYAHGLNLVIGEVAWVAEPGLRLAGSGNGHFGSQALRNAPPSGAGGVDGREIVELVPDEITIQAYVEVAFRIT